ATFIATARVRPGVVRPRRHVPEEGRSRDERRHKSQIPAVAFQVDLLEIQPAVADVVRLGETIGLRPLAAGVRVARQDRLVGEDDAVLHRLALASLLADPFLPSGFRLEAEQPLRTGWL